MDSITEAVARQYESFPYPPAEVDKKWDDLIATCDPSIASPLLWPEGRPREDLRILVAGCGTVQAARCALRNPGCSVLGIDVSRAALGAHEKLKVERNLVNLELLKLDLQEIGTIGRTFDLIFCTGVLMALAKPEEGLKALASALDPHGAMLIMLYGAAPRAGVYLLQDAFRRMGLGADQSSVEFVRTVLGGLPNHHYFNWYSANAPDLKADSGLVDTLLHAQDRAHSVPEVMHLVETCGLQFQAWEDNFFYFPEGNIRAGTPLWERLKSIPECDQWAVVENITLAIGRHSFIACRPERGYRQPDFSTCEYLTFIPKLVPGFIVAQAASLDPPRPARCRRDRFEFSVAPDEAILLANCNGENTIAQMVQHSGLGARTPTEREEFCRSFFQRMWKLGHVWMMTVPYRA